MDFLPGWIFLARGGALKAVSSSVPGIFAQSLWCRQTPVLLLPGIASGPVFIPGLPGSLARGRMGGLRQAAFRRARASLDYVGRYTHRVAISNNRLLDIAEDKVTFRYKDYRQDAQQKTMTLEAEEFIRRFLLHVLPEGFQRIRYYGFLANRYREQKLARCRELLA